jgi:dTDP-4-dehydrorhamnose reductase
MLFGMINQIYLLQEQPMKIAISGAQGLLGEELVRTLGTEHTILPMPSHRDLDLTDFNATRAWLLAAKPDAIFHTAAQRDPDPCEKDPNLAWDNNTLVTFNMVNAARELGAIFMHASSDSVFPGDRDEPYHEFDEPCNPVTVYGRSKLMSEILVRQYLPKHFNLRLPLLIGRTGGLTKNNLLKVRQAAISGQKTTAAGDAISTVCSVRDVARTVSKMLQTPYYGTYHLVNQGEISRAGILQAFLRAVGLDPDWVVVSSIGEMKKPAKRCRHVCLTSRLLQPVFGITLPPMADALAEIVADMKADGSI